MAEARVERRLAAILAADVAGYSRLMGVDEEGTLATLKAYQGELVYPKLAEHRGRIVKTTGDGVLVEFVSAVDAVRCAINIQRAIAKRSVDVPDDRRLELRIGISVGDIIADGGDIFGDGVNVAARLEGISEPGGICVSSQVEENARGTVDISFEDLGPQQLKNIAQPVHVYRVKLDATAPEGQQPKRQQLPVPNKPSIAVLPFQNMSGDPEQDYFADGVVEEIITAISRMRWLFVIARNSSFTYKGRAVDVKQVGRELGVRYVLEGSVRKAANRVRITGQLIDADTDAHLWADRFEGSLDDIFNLQDQVTMSVVGAIVPRLEQAEIERAKRKPTESLDAYDYFLRGMAALHEGTKDANNEARRIFYKAIELDTEFASAHARAAGDLDNGIAFLDRAIAINPNLAAAWGFSGRARVYRGEPETAIEHLAHAMRLSPLDWETYGFQGSTAYAHLFGGRYEEASIWAEKAIRENPNFLPVCIIAAASNALAGRMKEAKTAVERLRRIDPFLRTSNLKNALFFRRPEDIAKLVEGLQTAGLT